MACQGSIYVFDGTSGIIGASSVATRTVTGTQFGYAVSRTDLNGDGFADVLVATNSSKLHVYNGSSSWLPTSPSTTLTGTGGFGRVIAMGNPRERGIPYDVAELLGLSPWMPFLDLRLSMASPFNSCLRTWAWGEPNNATRRGLPSF